MLSPFKIINLLFSLILFFTFSSCEEKITIDDRDPEINTNPGSISVTVNFRYYDSSTPTPAALARVITHPYTKEYYTDQAGKVLIKDLPAGNYAIVAVVEFNYNSMATIYGGKEYVSIRSGSMSSTVINMVRNVGMAPSLFSSLSENWVSIDEDAILSVSAVDLLTPADSLTLLVTSSLSGNLFTGVMDLNGSKTIKLNNLVAGQHQIFISVENKKGIVSRDTLSLTNTAPHRATLTASLNDALDIVLTWVKTSDPDFLKYEIKQATNSYDKSDSVTIREISDESIKQFTDTGFPLVDQVFYKVNCITTTGKVRVGKWISIRPQYSIMGSMEISQYAFDPEKPVLYATITGNKLTAWNLVTRTKIAEVNAPSINNNLSPIITVGKNGGKTELFFMSSDNAIYIYDGETLAIKDTIVTAGPPMAIAYREPGILVVISEKTFDNYPTLTSYNSETRKKLSSFGPAYDLIAINSLVPRPGTETIMAFDNGSSGARSLEVNSSGIISQFQVYSVTGGYFDGFSKFSPNGNHVVSSYGYGYVYQFGTPLIFLGSPFQVSYSLKVCYDFSSDSKLLFAPVYNERKIRAYDLSPFSLNRYIITKTYPRLIKCYGSKLFVVGQRESSIYNGQTKIIESFDL